MQKMHKQMSLSKIFLIQCIYQTLENRCVMTQEGLILEGSKSCTHTRLNRQPVRDTITSTTPLLFPHTSPDRGRWGKPQVHACLHQQDNTPANNTPRAFLKAMFFDEQLNISDSALIRIHRGANTIHTYSGQRTAQQNGYVYVYATNESQFDVWFDDLFACPEYVEWVTHRTGPLLQACPDKRGKAHFYPFGQEITPLSSKAVLKTPNDRMLQQNEWDEEFGLDLHDFDARMYDASIGRFWGVDVLVEK
jgi:hypothetical protein